MFVGYVKLLDVVFIGFWGVAKGVFSADVFFETFYSRYDFVCWFWHFYAEVKAKSK